MNTRNVFLASAVAIALGMGVSTDARAQAATVQTTTTTTQNLGTITEFSPDTIIIRSESSPEPIRYSYSKTTTYVDENGAPVSMETVKSGLPVTVFYTRDGDRLIANRVVVRRSAAAVAPAPGAVVEKKTTTTTTTIDRKRDHDHDKDKDKDRD